MRRSAQIASLFGIMLVACLTACSRSGSLGDGVTGVKSDDPEMLAAIAKARETLPQFWEAFANPKTNETHFSLKVAITDKGQTEHFWTAEIEKQDGQIHGKISNDPEYVHSVKLGQRIPISDADISDWMYMRDGRIVGNRTIRALFKAMPKEEVEQHKKLLAEP